MASPSILRAAHGTGSSALLRAENPPLDEIPPTSAADTEEGLRVRAARGRPFERGNRAGANRGASLTRSGVDLDAPDEVRRGIQRRAETLRRQRAREMSVAHGGEVSSAVRVEVASWALATAWSRHFYDQGDAAQGGLAAERASAHQLRAVGLAEREAKAKPKKSVDYEALLAGPTKEGT